MRNSCMALKPIFAPALWEPWPRDRRSVAELNVSHTLKVTMSATDVA